MKRAMIAMSGGVDSSVSALLTKNEGYECVGAMMKLHDLKNHEGSCGSSTDAEDARAVAEKLCMDFHLFDFSDSFSQCIIDKFVESYEKGRTPNPCIDCNRNMKFNKLLKKIEELNCDFAVTGHYARVEYDEKSGRYLLKKAVDESKDQSYVLYMLTQEQLSHLRLPLGKFRKTEIREIAERNGFINAHKRDSQDICFVPDGDYAGFIERYTGKTHENGEFVLKDGASLGKSKSLINYTIGQRKGLGIAYTKPLYVCEIDTANNRVILGDNEDLFTDTLTADNVNLISVENLSEPMRVSAKVRYRHREQPATAYMTDDGLLHLKFDEPQRAVTKGQAVVLYDGDTVVGGGTII